MDVKQQHCLNCQTTLQGTYCHQCGQKDIKRLSFLDLWNAFQQFVISWEAPFARTFWSLSVAPAETARRYIQGQRVRFAHPVSYAFWMMTLMVLLASFKGVSITNFSAQTDTPESVNFVREISHIMDNVLAYLTFLVSWLAALANRLLFWRYHQRVIEYFYAQLYWAGHITILTILLLLFNLYSRTTFMTVFAVSIPYYVVALARFHQTGSALGRYLRAFAAVLLNFVFSAVVIGLGFAVYAYVVRSSAIFNS